MNYILILILVSWCHFYLTTFTILKVCEVLFIKNRLEKNAKVFNTTNWQTTISILICIWRMQCKLLASWGPAALALSSPILTNGFPTPLSYRHRSDMTPLGVFASHGLCESMALYTSFWLCIIVSPAPHQEICDVLKSMKRRRRVPQQGILLEPSAAGDPLDVFCNVGER